MAESKIEWTDYTFNPWWGCTKVSDGCANCYAETWSKRTGHDIWGPNRSRRFFGDKHWNEPLKWNAKAEREGWQFRVFCASMADVFEGAEHAGWQRLDVERERLWRLIENTPALTWQLLTKRPESISYMVPGVWHSKWPPNVWIGVSVENQATWDERVPVLCRIPAGVRFVSYEPALGPVDCHIDCDCGDRPVLRCLGCGDDRPQGVDWVIAGGESGPGSRPSHPDWFRSVRDQCRAAGVAFFFKQWGEWKPVAPQYGDTDSVMRSEDPYGEWFHDLWGRNLCLERDGSVSADYRGTWYQPSPLLNPWWLNRVGKKAAGRLLDGREWNEFPEVAR